MSETKKCYLCAALAGLGSVGAKKLTETYGSIENISHLSVKELREMGIPLKTANNVVRWETLPWKEELRFCEKNNISIRQLERMYVKYVGLPAISYNTLNRFHISVNQLLNTKFSKFSYLAYDNEYYDQMHFIREFKRFTGYTPKMFVSQNNSILQIGKMG